MERNGPGSADIQDPPHFFECPRAAGLDYGSWPRRRANQLDTVPYAPHNRAGRRLDGLGALRVLDRS